MSKTILLIQKIFVGLLLISAISFFIYHLYFMTPFFRLSLYGDTEGIQFARKAQEFNKELLNITIFGILISILLIALGLNKRRPGLFVTLITLGGCSYIVITAIMTYIQLQDLQVDLLNVVVNEELIRVGFDKSPVYIEAGQIITIVCIVIAVILALVAFINFIILISSFKKKGVLNNELEPIKEN